MVVSLLDHPVFDEGDHSGSSSFREPLEVVLGFVDSNGDFITYHFDSRRFAPVLPEKALSEPPRRRVHRNGWLNY